MLASWVRGDDHITRAPGAAPFTVGQVNPSKGFVHVFDDVTLDIILQNLDTIADFTHYLKDKENLFLNYSQIHCAGEEDFLGFYLENIDEEENFYRRLYATPWPPIP